MRSPEAMAERFWNALRQSQIGLSMEFWHELPFRQRERLAEAMAKAMTDD